MRLSLGEAISVCRERKGLSQKEFGLLVRAHQSLISKIESDESSALRSSTMQDVMAWLRLQPLTPEDLAEIEALYQHAQERRFGGIHVLEPPVTQQAAALQDVSLQIEDVVSNEVVSNEAVPNEAVRLVPIEDNDALPLRTTHRLVTSPIFVLIVISVLVVIFAGALSIVWMMPSSEVSHTEGLTAESISTVQPSKLITVVGLGPSTPCVFRKGGPYRSNTYQLDPGEGFTLQASGRSEQQGREDTAPEIACRVAGNFTMTTRVDADLPAVCCAHAGVGVRLPDDRLTWQRVTFDWARTLQRVGADRGAAIEEDRNPPLVYREKTIYIQIIRRGQRVTIDYRHPDSDWENLVDTSEIPLSDSVDVFFTVFARSSSLESVRAQFSEIHITHGEASDAFEGGR